MPYITAVGEAFGNLPTPVKNTVVAAIALLAILPKLITLCGTLTKAVTTVSAALTPVHAKILLIAAAVVLLISLIMKLINELNRLRGIETNYSIGNLIKDALDLDGLVTANTGGTSESSVTNITTNNVYDYSTMNNNISNEVDADAVIEEINNKIKARR